MPQDVIIAKKQIDEIQYQIDRIKDEFPMESQFDADIQREIASLHKRLATAKKSFYRTVRKYRAGVIAA